MAVGAIIGGVGAAAGALGNVFGRRRQARKTRQHEESMLQRQQEFASAEAEKERDHAIQMWEMTNQYNSPAEQMARLRAAGLNPNLAYGSGNVGGLAAGQPDHYKRAESPDFMKKSPPLDAAANAMQGLGIWQDYRMKSQAIRSQSIDNTLRGYQLPVGEEMAYLDLFKSRDMHQKGISEREMAYLKSKYTPELLKYQVEAKKAAIDATRSMTRGRDLENDLNALLKPYALTTRDSFLYRRLAKIMQDENPNVNAVDVFLLGSSMFPFMKGIKGARQIKNHIPKRGR